MVIPVRADSVKRSVSCVCVYSQITACQIRESNEDPVCSLHDGFRTRQILAVAPPTSASSQSLVVHPCGVLIHMYIIVITDPEKRQIEVG